VFGVLFLFLFVSVCDLCCAWFDADVQVEVLRRKCTELEKAVEEAESRGNDSGKAWRTNSKKMLNYGPLVPSSVTDPFAEEQRIMRERKQRLAEKERRKEERREMEHGTGPAPDMKMSATVLHP
jgi:hypothetical protein